MYLSDIQCRFCKRIAKSKNSNSQHEIRCKNNPTAIKIKPSYGMRGKKGKRAGNQYTKAKSLGLTFTIAESTRQKLSEANKKRKMSPEAREKHKQSMAKAVEKHPNSYLYGNSRKAKRYLYNNIMCQGTWELDFCKWCFDHQIKIERGTSFPYEWNGTIRKYFPDFYLPDLNLWIEVKGFETERDCAKWKSFPHSLVIIREQEIKSIRLGHFSLVGSAGLEPATNRFLCEQDACSKVK